MASEEETKQSPGEEELDDSELDAEGEDDEEFDQPAALEKHAPVQALSDLHVNSDVDAEGDSDEDALVEDDDEDEDDAAGEADSDASSSEPEENWEEEVSDANDDGDDKAANTCVFCGEKEENDPSEIYEEYLECIACSNNAHRQCARDNQTLENDEEADEWTCRTCLDKSEEPEQAGNARTRISTQTVANELLPAANDPDSHNMFDTLIMENDPMDGSRSLRKRKISEAELPHRDLRKRRRGSDAISASAGANPSFSPENMDMDTPQQENQDGEQEEAGRSGRPSRLRRPKKTERPPVSIISSEGISLIIGFALGERMQKILAARPKKNRWRPPTKKKIPVAPVLEPEPSHYPAIQSGYSAQFYGFLDKDTEDKTKPYGGILTETEADSSKTFPQVADRKRFEDARLKAEEDWKQKMAATNNAPDPTKPSHKSSGPPSKIKCINFGGFEIDTWNAAPYPEEYSRNKILYICEFCLKYMNSDYVAWRHKLKCPAQHPPGDEIYRDGKHSFFEVDGRKNPVYCQNLCLLAKLFLGSKTLYYDVEPFLFYVMTENDDLGCHFVGYFSKEKRPSSMNNVSCILVLPIYQRRGFGHMLIEFSYLLTKRERKTGSPEKPLSDMGLVSYRGYWRLVMCYQLVDQKGPISITSLSKKTGMTPDDVISALEALRALVRDPVSKTYAMRLDYAYYKEYIEKYEKKNYPRIKEDALVWTKYLMNRGLSHHYEVGGPLHTVAPREDEDESESKEDNDNAVSEDVEMAEVDTAEAETNGVFESTEEGTQTNGVATEDEAPHPPSTPVRQGPTELNGISTPGNAGTGMIPASRFEVFPPVPGFTGRKRGRPVGATGRRRLTDTPRSSIAMMQSVSTRTVGTAVMLNGSPSLRRTRSGGIGDVGAVLSNGDGAAQVDGDADGEAED
ncbi:hypothetical protein BT63DRAFT_381595 [Microthyrium microscopicum]|uniref:Histone acetyltransferase n=1 Tax=Microthyrium microscopicum TaxID=703497 RepID=A0A6A6UTY3_9PEZI|nr:hypothetical protein BT63DRAFT_381595 [Microthyrium microscopicum]